MRRADGSRWRRPIAGRSPEAEATAYLTVATTHAAAVRSGCSCVRTVP
ncbi:hypothetical protein [Lysobacter gummosus]